MQYKRIYVNIVAHSLFSTEKKCLAIIVLGPKEAQATPPFSFSFLWPKLLRHLCSYTNINHLALSTRIMVSKLHHIDTITIQASLLHVQAQT